MSHRADPDPSRPSIREAVLFGIGLVPVAYAAVEILGVSEVPVVATTMGVLTALLRIAAVPSSIALIDRVAPWLSGKIPAPPDEETASPGRVEE